MLNRVLPILLLLLTLTTASWGQSRAHLEAKRKSLIKDIKKTSRLLQKTSKDRVLALDRFRALEAQIKNRQELIETLYAELAYAEESLERTSNVVFSLEEDLDRLEQEYGAMARSALRQRINRNTLLFLFSAADFNQAFQRWQYIRQYDAYRKRQTNLVLETKGQLATKLQQLESSKLEKEQLIEETESQNSLLADELNDKSVLLSTLKKDEARLKKNLDRQQKDHEKLNDAIEKVIQEEIIASRKRERSRSALEGRSGNSKKPKATPEVSIASQNFVKNQGRLPWPVSSGVIIKHFGKQSHPTLKSVQITNNGIDIQTDPNAKVRCVFQGTVVGKQFVPGFDNMIIVKHGAYYTVYSNLKEVYVKKGDAVMTKQNIGVASKKGNISQVHFEVWQGKERLNPANWIARG